MAEIITMPKLGFDMAEGTLMRWVKAEGETVQKGEVLAEIETDKATVEVESAFSGIVHRHLVEEGAIVPVGSPITVIAAPGEEVKETLVTGSLQQERAVAQPATTEPREASATTSGAAALSEKEKSLLRASPLARRMARENQLELEKIEGSGPEGRIVRRDIEQALKAEGQKLAVTESSSLGLPPLPALAGEKFVSAAGDQRVPINRLRAAIGRRMVESKQALPHFYVTQDYDMEKVMGLRQQINALLVEDEKLSVNDFIIKAVALGLRQFPNLNASLVGNEIVRHGAVNIGVAVAVEGGLLTVVVRNADLKPLRLISREVKELVGRARQGKVRPEDIEGSTFSISNLGMFDVEHFIAIINPPEAAILAVGAVKLVPAVMDGEVKPRMRMKTTLSADHRVTDGAEAAQFLQALGRYLEEPLLLLI
ncbi:MAG: 2-oxo acid dehydrogenase subunit E2 [Anaerolineae bacterium]|nr:2-oxo acid dehydrogenase subunit E2 [Anaerolineae bacterium]